jgi:glycosyltransferase involved in cell wall biosynthesis
MKILLLSPYDAPSHVYWRRGLCRHLGDWEWTCLTLPARFFSWRVRGNSLTWSQEQRAVLEAPYDLLVATSMTDLATLRGLVPRLTAVPSVLYFHENQFAYPASTRQRVGVEPQMVSLYAALAADHLLFNSRYNLDSFMAGVTELLRKLPDAVPRGVVEQLANKADVLPVPLETPARGPVARHPGPLQVVWNHRWEYDKGPELLLAAIEQLPPHLSLQFHIIGQQFRREPAEFARIRNVLEQRGWLGRWGYVETLDQYHALLAGAHVVLSTAHHDFQGLAVLEAVAEGCLPLVPERLAYPEWFTPHWMYRSGAGETASLCAQLQMLAETPRCPEPPDVSALSWEHLRPVYRTILTNVVKAGTDHF